MAPRPLTSLVRSAAASPPCACCASSLRPPSAAADDAASADAGSVTCLEGCWWCSAPRQHECRRGICRIGCEAVPPDVCRRVVPRPPATSRSALHRFARAGRNAIVDTASSRYMCASIVYVIYALVIMCIDIYSFGGFYGALYADVELGRNYSDAATSPLAALAAAPTLDDDGGGYWHGVLAEATQDVYWTSYYGRASLSLVPIYTGTFSLTVASTNSLFLFAGMLHFINAWQYVYAWHGRRWDDIVLFPEYLNVVGSWLYLISATWYPEADALVKSFDYTNPLLMRVHYLETAAASWELFAAFGWTYSWWKTFQRKPGRGCTLDDPDLHGGMMIVVPSIIYLVYNIQLLLDPTLYGVNELYMVGDAAYLAGALAYLVGALRDVGCLWWVPRFGRCPDECPDIPDWCGVESKWPARTDDDNRVLAEVGANCDAGEDDDKAEGDADGRPIGAAAAAAAAALPPGLEVGGGGLDPEYGGSMTPGAGLTQKRGGAPAAGRAPVGGVLAAAMGGADAAAASRSGVVATGNPMNMLDATAAAGGARGAATAASAAAQRPALAAKIGGAGTQISF